MKGYCPPNSKNDPATVREKVVSAQRGFKGAGKGPGSATSAFKGAAPRTAMEPFRKGKGA